MNVHIGEMNSSIRAIDSQMLLDDRTVDRLTKIVMKRMRDQMDHDERVEEERKSPCSRRFEEG